MAEHRCEKCQPLQDELDRLGENAQENFDEVFFLEYRLLQFRKFVCAETPPPLLDSYQPGGSRREWFLENRIVAKCPPCQRLADEYLVVSEFARDYRAMAQQEELDALDGKRVDPYDSMKDPAERATRYAEILAELLAECERTKCPKTDEERASEAVLDVIETATPPPSQGDDEDSTTVEPHQESSKPSSVSSEGGVGYHWGGGESTPITPNADEVVRKAGGFASLGVWGWVFGILLLGVVAAGLGWAFFGGSDSEGPTEVVASDFSNSPAVQAAAAAAIGFGGDRETVRSCIANGLALRNTTDEEIEAMADPDVSTWPPGLDERLAEALEDCDELRQYYLTWFGEFEFENPECVTIMTDHVMANYSWLRFLREGILDDNLRAQIQTQFNLFVDNGYVEKGCFAATG